MSQNTPPRKAKQKVVSVKTLEAVHAAQRQSDTAFPFLANPPLPETRPASFFHDPEARRGAFRAMLPTPHDIASARFAHEEAMRQAFLEDVKSHLLDACLTIHETSVTFLTPAEMTPAMLSDLEGALNELGYTVSRTAFHVEGVTPKVGSKEAWAVRLKTHEASPSAPKSDLSF